MTMKKNSLYVALNSIETDSSDPTITKATFVIHDFEESHNEQVLTREVVEENMHTLVGKPVVCRYIPKELNNGLDALTDHELTIDTDRKTDEEFITTKTIAIGYFDSVNIQTVDVDGDSKEVLLGDAVLWSDKYPNIVGLLEEWLDRGVTIPTSVEYAYINYTLKDGIEYVHSPVVYLAHAILNAEDRNDYEKVLPAFDSSQLVALSSDWNKAMQQAENNKGGNSVEYIKKVCQIPLTERIGKIYQVVKEHMSADEYENMWIFDHLIYNDYFIAETWNGDGYKYHKYPYSVNEEENVVIDFEGITEVDTVTTWEEVQNSLDELSKENEGLTKAKEELEAKLNELEEAKETEAEEVEEEVEAEEDNTSEEEVEETEEVEVEEVEAEEDSEDIKELQNTIKALEEKVEALAHAEEKLKELEFEKDYNSIYEEVSNKLSEFDATDLLEDEEFTQLLKESVNSLEAKVKVQDIIIEHLANINPSKSADKHTFNNKKMPNANNKKRASFRERYYK